MSKSNIMEPVVQVPSKSLHLGIDLGWRNNVVVVIDESGEDVDGFRFSQDRAGYQWFLQRVKRLQHRAGAGSLEVAMEPTNYFWKLMARELEQRGIHYHLVNAYTVRKHREGDQLDRSKDDRRDARQIAELSRTAHYTQTRLQRGGYEDLRQYAALYDQLRQSMRRERQLLWVGVGQVFPEIFQAFQDLGGDTCQALLRTCAPAVSIRQLTLEAFLVQVRSGYRGKRLLVSKLRRTYELAATSIGVTEGSEAIQLAIRAHLSCLETQQRQMNRATETMRACLSSLPEAPFLKSLLGDVSAALVLAEIGDPKHYRSAAQWVKLAGIQPAPNTSGQKQSGRTPMSHQGRPRLRTVLYFACLRMIQLDPHFIQLYAHLRNRPKNPLTKMQALGVLMNKLLHILWALVQNHTFYDPSFSSVT